MSDNKNDGFLGNIYNDFFNIDFTKKTGEKIDEELAALTEQLKKFEINTMNNETISDLIAQKEEAKKLPENANPEMKKEEQRNDEPKKIIPPEDKEEKLNEFFERIDNLYITEESKQTMRKMIIYAKKYYEGIVKQYIPFNFRLYSDNREVTKDVVTCLTDGLYYFGYIQGNKKYETSFYQASAEDLVNIYKSSYNVIILKDTDGITGLKEMVKKGLLTLWEDKLLKQDNRQLTVVVDKNEEKVNAALESQIIIKDKIFDFAIQTVKPDEQDIYQDLLKKLKADFESTSEFELKLLDYIVGTYSKTTLTYPEYRDSVYEKILFNKVEEKLTEDIIPAYEKDKSIDEIFAELNDLVGLQNVKDMLKDLVSLMEFREKAGNEVNIKNTNLHMVFLGNPGTGKTTVARIVAGILYNLKYIRQNKLIEVSAKDLVGEYVGQTAPKTMAVVERAMDGVLFIDEAYSLASTPGENNSFNEECVATLIQAMENYRDRLVVVFAGYSKEMQDFLNTNSGIVSRIGYTLTFEDYKVDELITIFKSMMKKSGFVVEDKAIEKVKTIVEEYKSSPNFGNARFVRNLYEKTIIKHATNCKGKTSKKAIKTIVEEDISVENLIK